MTIVTPDEFFTTFSDGFQRQPPKQIQRLNVQPRYAAPPMWNMHQSAGSPVHRWIAPPALPTASPMFTVVPRASHGLRIAFGTQATFGIACQHRTDQHRVNPSSLNQRGGGFGDHFTSRDNRFAGGSSTSAPFRRPSKRSPKPTIKSAPDITARVVIPRVVRNLLR